MTTGIRPRCARLPAMGHFRRATVIAGALLVATAAFASQSYKPPASGEAWTIGKVYMKAVTQGEKAEGVVAFLCNEPEGQHRIQFFARNLRPGGVYSLWLIADGETDQPARARRLTRRIRPQRADDKGEFRLVVATLHCLVARYDRVMLRHHPPGSRPNVASGTAVLAGRIGREAHESPGGAGSGPLRPRASSSPRNHATAGAGPG